jgi:hypothetical protein
MGYEQQPGLTSNISSGGQYDDLDRVSYLQYTVEGAESAAEAAISAAQAAASAAAALTSANNADDSEASALASANTAASAATAASSSATNASNSATQANNAKVAAETAQTAAQTAKTAAELAETNAETAEVNAETAQAAAEAALASTQSIYDNFDDRYLGPKASDPSTDNDGNALLTGALYFNTTVPEIRVYTGSFWTDFSAGAAVSSFNTRTGPVTLLDTDVNTALGYTAANASSVVLKANNLSDLANVATARTNLGLGSAALLTAGAANGAATLDSGGTVPLSQLPTSIQGGVSYQGTWNASTNTPTLTSSVGNKGNYYVVSVAGSTNLNGVSEWKINDWAIFNGTAWEKIDNTDLVTSVNGYTGTVALTYTDVGAASAAQGILADSAIQSLTSNDGSIALNASGTSIDLSVGTAGSTARVISQVRNETGATLTKGTIVYISGASGSKALVSKAIATSDATSAQTYGMVQSDIANNQNGYVVVIGSVVGLDTSSFSDGTQLYLSGTTAGTYTSVKPYAPIHLVYIGVVTRSHVNQGTIEVKIQNGYELDEIHDVSITSEQNNDILVYESSTNLWKNRQGTSLYDSAGEAVALAIALG